MVTGQGTSKITAMVSRIWARIVTPTLPRVPVSRLGAIAPKRRRVTAFRRLAQVPIRVRAVPLERPRCRRVAGRRRSRS